MPDGEQVENEALMWIRNVSVAYLLGVMMQAWATALLTVLGIITLSPGQQLMCGLLSLLVVGFMLVWWRRVPRQ